MKFLRKRWVRWALGVPLGLVVTTVIAWHVAIRVVAFPRELLARPDATSLVVEDATGAVLRQEATSAGGRDSWVSLDKISQHLVDATLASEDNDFYDHGGVDWTALGRAAWLDLRGRAIDFGGSTITMQLVRLVAGTGRHSFGGKLRQLVLAGRLERLLSKREILEQYLNRVYYGNGAWGAEQASRLYFRKHASELSVGEAALLAVIPRGPTMYDPFRARDRLMQRRTHILALMEEHGYLDAEQRALAERVPLDHAKSPPSFAAPHFVDLVKQRLPDDFKKGAIVNTTLDPDLQHHLEVALETHLQHVAGRHVTEAAVVVIRNRDGAVLGLVGSRDYAAHAFDGATARLRPGSALKPFVYGAAFEMGDSPATLAEDVVLPEDAHQAYAKDVRSHGFARYRESLAGSYNLSAVHTLQRVGIPTVLRKLRAAGITTLDRADDQYGWGLAVGEAEVRLIELAGAYTSLGREGVPIAPRTIDRARTPDGREWREPVLVRERVFTEEAAAQLFDVLSDPEARKPMFGDRVPMNLPFPVALKTGTTKAYTDLWAFGTTREFTVGVWAGNFDGSPTYKVMSTEGATPLVRAAYVAIAARYGEPTAPDRPNTLVEDEVCPLSGKKPGPYCEHRKRELFVVGHTPTETCDWHRLVCGQPTVVYPESVKGFVRFFGAPPVPTCDAPDPDAQVVIAQPVMNARFVLEPHRPATAQRPPLATVPAIADARWTIDGTPAEKWVPTVGTHHVVVEHGRSSAAVDITYAQ